MLATGLAFTGCSSDNAPDSPDRVVEAGTQFYIRVAIANADGATRAGYTDNTDESNYTDGDKTTESAVKSVLFVFYNADGGYVANKTIANPTLSAGSDNIESLLDIVVPVTIQETSKIPAYVVAYVNPTTSASSNVTGNLEDIQKRIRSLADVLPSGTQEGTNTNGFLMTNSVYYEEGSNAPIVAAPVPPTALYESEADAKKGDASITVYVERAMAKVNVFTNRTDEGGNGTLADAPQTVVNAGDQANYTLSFDAKAWGLNNEEKNTYILKNFRTGSVNIPNPIDENTQLPSIANMSWSEANSAMSSLTSPDWNYPAKTEANKGRRSFWAYSPNYFNATTYPEYSDQISTSNPSPLNQISVTEIWDTENNKRGTKGHDFGTGAYTLENTVSDAVLRETKAGVRAITSAVIVGKYTVKNADGTEVRYDNLYLRRGISVSEGTTSNIVYVGNDYMMQSFLSQQTATDGVIFVKNAASSTPEYSPVSWADANKDNIKADFEIVHPEKDVTGVYTANRFVTLQLKSTATLTKTEGEGDDAKQVPKYYYRDNNGLMTAVASGNRNLVNIALYQHLNAKLGAVEMFNGGYAYFKVPIRHLWGQNNKGFGDSATATLDGFVLGQYGVVRNHIYNINVTAIGGIGTGISDPDEPIVFPITEKEYFVKTEIRVQKWRIVPTQDVILKP